MSSAPPEGDVRSLKSSSERSGPGTASPFAGHRPVLVAEILDAFAPCPDGLLVDGTVGGGGHARALLEGRPGFRLLGFDRDPDALAAAAANLSPFGDRVTLCHTSFAELPSALRAQGEPRIAALLCDLGVSSHQLDTPERGFSLQREGPLDMRLDPTSGKTLAESLADVDEAALAQILEDWGDVPRARRVAHTILRRFGEGRLRTTIDLATAVSGLLPRRAHVAPATPVFQALRIWVNDELGALKSLLDVGPGHLMPGGRLAFLTFHSGEDRLVKHGLRHIAEDRERFKLVTRRSVTATEEERHDNPRSRSARLRVLERIRDDAEADEGR